MVFVFNKLSNLNYKSKDKPILLLSTEKANKILSERLQNQMIIVNSKQFSSMQHIPSSAIKQHKYLSSQKQYQQISQLQAEEEQSIVQWIKQYFSFQYAHCRKVNKIQDLFDGIALAQMVSHYLSSQEMKENFLNQIQVIGKIQSQKDAQIAANNINQVIYVLKQLFFQTFQTIKNSGIISKQIMDLMKVIQLADSSLKKLNGKGLISNNNRMKDFIMQIIMILPQIQNILRDISSFKPNQQQSSLKQQSKHIKQKRHQKDNNKNSVDPMNLQNHRENNHNIEQLSSIMMYSSVANNRNRLNSGTKSKSDRIVLRNSGCKQSKTNYISQTLNQNQRQNCQTQSDQCMAEYDFRNQDQNLFEMKVEKLLDWIQNQYSIDISHLKQPHLLLGQLLNAILAPNRLKDNQKPIKPSHYELGSYAVYKKVLNILVDVERLTKTNLIKLMREVQQGQVKQDTFWSLIQDIQFMVRNKSSNLSLQSNKKPNPIKNSSKHKKLSTQRQTQQTQRLYTQNAQNINMDNLKNLSVTQILKVNQESKKGTQMNAPLYDEELIKQTQLWLQQQMGMSHPLSKSKPNSKTSILQNPLLNGTLYAKIIQRLKIGAAKGMITPVQKNHLKNNIQIIKNQLLHRGFECARKLSIYRPSYNFYIGLLSQIRQTNKNKQNSSKQLIINDKRKRQQQDNLAQITESQKIELQLWLDNEYRLTLVQVNSIKQISLTQLKTVIESVINANFLKQTTQKIRHSNYVKLLEFFRSLGFTHYSSVKIDDIVSQNMSINRKSQNIRWMILRDIRLIKGEITHNTTRQSNQRI